MRIRASALALASVAALSFAGQGAADAAVSHLTIPSIGVNVPVVKVPVKHGGLAIGGDPRVIYTEQGGDPPCDPLGTTVYAGHAWKSGDGVADNWGSLKHGRLITVAGCRFRVMKREYWPADRPIRGLARPDGPPRIVLIGCKADDYSKHTMVFARKVK